MSETIRWGCAVKKANDSILLDLMRANTDLNECSRNCHVSELSWGEPIPADVPKEVDVVLAADCVYFEVSPRSVEIGSECRDRNCALLTWRSRDQSRPRPALAFSVQAECEGLGMSMVQLRTRLRT